MLRDELVREMKADAALGADRTREHDQQIEAARDLPAPQIAGGGRPPVVRAEAAARASDGARRLDNPAASTPVSSAAKLGVNAAYSSFSAMMKLSNVTESSGRAARR